MYDGYILRAGTLYQLFNMTASFASRPDKRYTFYKYSTIPAHRTEYTEGLYRRGLHDIDQSPARLHRN